MREAAMAVGMSPARWGPVWDWCSEGRKIRGGGGEPIVVNGVLKWPYRWATGVKYPYL